MFSPGGGAPYMHAYMRLNIYLSLALGWVLFCRSPTNKINNPFSVFFFIFFFFFFLSDSMATEQDTIMIRLNPPPSTTTVHPISTTKPSNPRFFSFFLKSLVMFFVFILFCLFVGIAFAFILIVHFCIQGRNRFPRRQHRHYHPSIEQEGFFDFRDGAGLSPNQLQNLPCSNYTSLLDSVSTRDCAVCLEAFSEAQLFRFLPRCKHVFHANCIELWLNKASSCPICRRDVFEPHKGYHSF